MTLGEIEALRKGIAALEAQRAILGDAAVDAALGPLQEKLADLTRAAPPTDERKRITVLFSDLAGFTAMSESMDPEDVHSLIDAYFARMKPAITRFGGTIEKYIGDAVMALFGAPHALENHEEMAVRAALAMHRALDDFNQELEREQGIRLAMRIGLNTGLVMYGSMGGKESGDFTVIGDTVNLASRLEHAAPIGGVLISGETARRLHGVFDFEPPQQITVKGKGEPITVYVVVGEKAERGRVRGVAGLHAPMVGRDEELKALQAAFEEALAEGRWRVAGLVGEAGIGKTRLRREFIAWVKQAHPETRLLIGRCYAHTRNTPYYLVGELVGGLFNVDREGDPAVALERLEEGLRALDPATGEEEFRYRLGSLAGVLGLSPPKDPLRSLDPEQRRDRTFLSLERLLLSVSSTTPLLVVVDDLHWADDLSLSFIERLIQVTGRDAEGDHVALFLCISRPAEVDPSPLASLLDRMAHPPCRMLTLRPLDEKQSDLLVAGLLAGIDLPSDVLALVTQRAEGNPFFVEELLRKLIEDGTLIHDPETDRWRVAQAVTEVEVPGTVQGVLAARLDRLPAGDKQVVQRAAVSGRTFWEQLLAELAEDGIDVEAALEPILARLEERRLVVRLGESQIVDDWEWIFRHVLTQEVAYASLPKGTRRRVHARVARWLEERVEGQGDGFVPLIAYHYDQGGVRDRAIPYLRRAGEQAATQFANADAVRYLSRALELVGEDDRRERYELLLAREEIYHLQGDRAAQAQDLESLTSLAEGMEDDRRRAEVALRRARCAQATSDYPATVQLAQQAVQLGQAAQDIAIEAQAHRWWGSGLLVQGDYDAARAHLEQALRLAQAASLRRVEATSQHGLGKIALDQGDYVQARRDYEKALQIYREIGDRRGEGNGLNSLGILHGRQGEPEKAEAYYREALRIQREMGDRGGEASQLNNLGTVADDQGKHEQALSYYQQSLDICREVGNIRGVAISLDNRGLIFVSRGSYTKAKSTFEEALDTYRAVGDRRGESNALNNLGYVASLLGDYGEARSYFEQALAIYRQIGYRWGEGIVLDDLGFVSHHLGDNEAGLEYERQAVEITQELGARSTMGYALTHLGHVLAGLGRLEEAADAYRRGLEARRGVGQQNRAMAPLAGLAWVFLEQGDTRRAKARVEEILDHLQEGSLDGCMEPSRIYMTCYRVLRRVRDPRAREVLEEGYCLLQERAGRIPDAETRRLFLEGVAARRELVREMEREKGDVSSQTVK